MNATLPLLAGMLLLATGCPSIDDDDDDITPDPACTDGWEPLAILDDFEGDIRDYSVDPASSTLAAVTERHLDVYDLSEPRTPVLLETFDVQQLVDPTAVWAAISAAEGGHIVLGDGRTRPEAGHMCSW